MQYLNTYRPAPPPAAFVELHENTPVQAYDLNSVLPIPHSPLETEKLRIEPLIVCEIPLSEAGLTIHSPFYTPKSCPMRL